MVQPSKITGAFLGSMGLVFILILILIFRKPEVIIQGPDNTKELRDSITLLTGQIEKEKAYTDRYKTMADSLMNLPPKVKVFYYEKKQFVTRATIVQLDSIIRTASGLPIWPAYSR